jgi:hypothetical protein
VAELDPHDLVVNYVLFLDRVTRLEPIHHRREVRHLGFFQVKLKEIPKGLII